MLAFIACESALLRTGPLGYAMLQFRQHLSPTPMPRRSCLAIVLAAGEGTRMRSALPKALHAIGGRTLLAHVLGAAIKAGGGEIAVVVGPDHDAIDAAARGLAPKTKIFVQKERRGTAHAVLAARKAIVGGADDILVMFADTPLVRPQTLSELRAALARGAAVAVLGFRPTNPAGYGRLLTRGDELLAIREERDATPEERKIALCNGGLMALSGKTALAILDRIGNANAKSEYYLSDAVAIARDMGLKAVAIETGEDDMRGINTKAQLAETEAVLQKRLRAAALDAGVTMIAPETVFLCADTKFGKDVTIEPNVVFGPGVTVGDGAYVGTGLMVTKSVPTGALAVARGEQTIKTDWAKRLRRRKGLGKKKPKPPTT
jgi:bifunctional UDP-N-acetylglucosamine pyrophosphorylase/glucosamine-1-phosphate N-acetyltransferase